MSYTVMVAKHHDGLCWWDAPNTDRTVVAAGPRRNVLAEYAAACERAELVFGTYYSLLDWSDPRYPSCEYVEQVVHPHVLDLVGRYGSRMLWGDGHWGGGGSHWRSDELIAAARERNPSIIVNDRWWSDGPGVRSFEYRLPAAITDTPWEMRRGLGGSFGYNRAERTEHMLSPRAIVTLLSEVVAKGGHLLLSVGPDAAGRIPAMQVEPLRQAGVWIQRHEQLINRATPWKEWGDKRARYLMLDDDLHAVDIDGSGRFAALDRSAGHVRSVARIDGGWRHARELRAEQRRPLGRPPPPSGPAGTGRCRRHRGLPDRARPTAPGTDRALPRRRRTTRRARLRARRRQTRLIVQLGDGTYLGPGADSRRRDRARAGTRRTVIDGRDSQALSIGRDAHLEHCTLRGGGPRIVWLPKVVAVLSGPGAVMLGCTVDGHVEVASDDCPRHIVARSTGVVAKGVDRVGYRGRRSPA